MTLIPRAWPVPLVLASSVMIVLRFWIWFIQSAMRVNHMNKHANETRACTVNSNARSQLHAPTDAAAPGRAFPASRQALQVPQLRRRQHTDRDNTYTPDKEDKARAQCKAPRCCVNASVPRCCVQCTLHCTQQRGAWYTHASVPGPGASS